MNVKVKYIFVLIIFIIFIIDIMVYIFSPANGENFSKIIKITPKMGAKKIAFLLEEKGLIKDKKIFLLLSTLLRVNDKLKKGEYKMNSSLNCWQVLNKLIEGKKTLYYKITIVEGSNVLEIANLLASYGLVKKDDFIKYTQDKFLLYELNISAKSFEGYLFPDTYFINKNTKEKEIIKMMVKRFKEMFKEEYIKRANQLNFSIHQVITLASLIEKEAKIQEEKKLVSAVFHNRLKQRIKLESCATIRYILNKYKDRLTDCDLKVYSPYNTYLHLGLPPGPIANPGEAAIIAALYPTKTNFMYFVSKQNGTHFFSYTLKEHLKAKAFYQNNYVR